MLNSRVDALTASFLMEQELYRALAQIWTVPVNNRGRTKSLSDKC